jgi:asparagine synthase (glutamine-hydrolysing)
MCGIVGIVSQAPIKEHDVLTTQRDTMYHRGPDDAGVWWSEDGCVGLAHRRLAIIDLSPAGHQPMMDESGKLCIVFNGEIYNFKDLRRELEARGHCFRSSSDTEVILAAYREWGNDCIQHFNGMFAFGLFDGNQKRLFLARDRAGEKPLFYRLSNGTLTFASELKALMADPAFPRRLNPEALDCYLAFGYVPGDRCILKGVSKLPPAHALTFDLDSGICCMWRYWQLPAPPETNKEVDRVDEVILLDELEGLLEDAVRRQLVADVPVGILLSGGIDSSLTTAMAVRSVQNVKTFTIRFPGYGEHDETEHARLIARHFGTGHVELEAGPYTVDLLPLLARQFDEPVVDSSMIPTYLISKLVRHHCTVALGGDGGDELFGGYKHYNRLLWLYEKLGWIPYGLRKGCKGMAEALLPLGFKGRNWLQGLGVDLKTGLPLIATYFDRGSRCSLLGTDLVDGRSDTDSAESIRQGRIPQTPNLLQRATRMDFENYLAEDIMVKVDRASMLNSLEVRAPWLDYRIIEFAFGRVPSRLKVTSTSRKILPKLLASRILPPEFDLHRKQGFSIPLASWLQGQEWGNFFREVLLEPKDSLFDRRFVADLFAGQELGRSNSERLFGLMLFELWRREYRVTV